MSGVFGGRAVWGTERDVLPLPRLPSRLPPLRRVSSAVRARVQSRAVLNGKINASASALNALDRNRPLEVWRAPRKAVASIAESSDRKSEVLRGLRDDHVRFQGEESRALPQPTCQIPDAVTTFRGHRAKSLAPVMRGSHTLCRQHVETSRRTTS